MKNIEPSNQLQLYGLNEYLKELLFLYKNNNLPNKILLSGQRGQGKSTLAYHFINNVLSYDEEFKYDIDKQKINSENHSFKTILNKSNPNFISINVITDKKFIDINQIRELILNLNKLLISFKILYSS